MADPLPEADFRHVRFADVLERGPSIAERVAGSAALGRRQAVGRALCRLLGRLQVSGLDRVPDTGPVILAVNHTSLLDGPLVFGLVRRPVSFLVKAEAFEPLGGLAGSVLRGAGQLPVRRYQIDPGPVRYGLALLRQGGVLGMFPEGTRGAGLAGSVRPGVGYFAVKTGAPVLPVAVLGTAASMRTVRRPPVVVRFGEPLSFPAAPAGTVVNRGRWLAAAEAVRQALAALVADAVANRPASDPAGRPASDPAGRPASDPADRPASDPADLPVGDVPPRTTMEA